VNVTNSGQSGGGGSPGNPNESAAGPSTNSGHYLVGGELRVDSEAAVFSLEMLVKVVLQNRDRVACFWPLVRNHLCNTIVNAAEYSFLLERSVVGLLRISARLLRREELCNEVLSSLRMLLMFKNKSLIRRLSRQVAQCLCVEMCRAVFVCLFGQFLQLAYSQHIFLIEI
jgi:hypothetical protein